MDFSKLSKLVFSDLENNNKSTIMFRSFPKEKVSQALQNPQKNEVTLRNLSNFLYVLSPHYKRLCNYYGQMLKYDYYLEPYKLDTEKIDKKIFKKNYFEALNSLDNMSIKHELQKISEILFKEGVFYGYEYSTDDSYFIQKLDADYCKITSVEDGVYNYSFNFQYFEKNPDLLLNYAPEFTKKYNLYKNKKTNKKKTKDSINYQWQEINSENSICIKLDETVTYSFPPFVGVLPDIYDIQDYKALKKANKEMQNYAILVGSIPYNKNSDTANDFALELNTAIDFGNKMTESLPDQVGFLLSVYDKMELFKLGEDKIGSDSVSEAINNFWEDSGTTKDLFTGSGGTDASMKRAIATDEQIVFNLLRQYERWFNRKLKFNDKKYKFRINFLDITRFNENDVVNRLQKSASYGLPIKTQLCSALGLSPSSVSSMMYLENDILDLPNNFIPLISANTVSVKQNSPTNGENGRPSQEQTEQSSGGED